MRLVVFLALVTVACGQPVPKHRTVAPAAQCDTLKKHGQVTEARACYGKLLSSSDAFARAEAAWAMNDYKSANTAFQAAESQNSKDPDVKVRWGRMYLERAQPADAAKLFGEALEVQPDYAPALLGMALVAADHFDPKASEFAEKALKSDPNLVEAQEVLARIALEDNNSDKAVAEADKAIAMSPEALDALAIRATVDWMNDKPNSPYMEKIQKINPVYGKVYATAGHFFVINRRYDEGIALYRKALELDPTLWEAKSDLGVNLMRLGQEQEARKVLEEVFNDGLSTEPVRNTLKLMDRYKDYVTFTTPKTILRFHKKEADVLRPYFQAELDRAMAVYEKKYQVKIDKPVQVEVYTNHADFEIRTVGMPGLGALGVTFGTVVAMDSPSGRKPGEWHWATTLWHELSHVYVLTATQHRVPRWFTEGMAVHEETATASDWGDRLSPPVIQAIKEKKLLPVADLDRGFVHPTYPNQVFVSYYQGGKICDYIKEMYGYPKLIDMMHAFADRKTTPEVFEQVLKIKPEEFDKGFVAWVEKQTLPTVTKLPDWQKGRRLTMEMVSGKKYDEAIAEGNAIRDIYPDFVETDSVYELLANAYQSKGDLGAARKQLEAYASVGGRTPATLKKLAFLDTQAGDNKAAAIALEKLNFIYPLDPELHDSLGKLYFDLKNYPGAVREYEAVVNYKPIDPAGSHYNLARAYNAAGNKEKAKDEVLVSLEAAPGYKPAQKLLLELDGKD